jgi:hypothetical protein
METLQRFCDVAAGFLRVNALNLSLFITLASAWLLGLISQEACMLGGMALGLGQYSNILTTQTAVGTAFGTFTAAKSVINATNLLQLPPNYLYVGKKIRVTARGALTTLVTTPGTVTFQIMMGNIVVWTSGAIQMNATAHTSLPFNLNVDLRCDSIGSGTTAKFLGMGVLQGIMFTLTAAQVDGVNSSAVMAVPATAPAVGTGFDSTIANLLDFWTGFSISSASNVVQLFDYTVEELN